MTTENQLVQDPVQRLGQLQARMADFASKWREWAHANQPNVRRCESHAFDRRVDQERSIGVSWQRQEFLVIYKMCPGCWRERNETKKKLKTTKPRGVQMPHKKRLRL